MYARFRLFSLAAAMTLTCWGSPLHAAPDRSLSPAVVALQTCQKISEPTARLACLDRHVGELVEGTQSGKLSVVDQQSARALRRSLFGFTVPNLKILGLGAEAETEARSLEAKVHSVRALGNGRYRIRLEDGATWETVERPDSGEEPRAGSTVRLRRAMLGSFFMNIDDNRAVRARRVE